MQKRSQVLVLFDQTSNPKEILFIFRGFPAENSRIRFLISWGLPTLLWELTLYKKKINTGMINSYNSAIPFFCICSNYYFAICFNFIPEIQTVWQPWQQYRSRSYAEILRQFCGKNKISFGFGVRFHDFPDNIIVWHLPLKICGKSAEKHSFGFWIRFHDFPRV